ncbi:MAG: hypothetical protein IK031_01685 [Bacteroidales bacterium]|nr:hypothetical protein [Bacteroidales bacterium]
MLTLLLREVLLLAVELLREVPLLPEREVLALLRVLELLLRVVLVVALLRFEELLEREVVALLRLEELLERLLLELLIVPPTALETDDDDELRLPLLTEDELRELPEDDEERDVVWLEDERLLPPLLDWALTVQGVSAIATAAAAESAIL